MPESKKGTLAQVFSREFCEISKTTFSHRTPLMAASLTHTVTLKVTFTTWLASEAVNRIFTTKQAFLKILQSSQVCNFIVKRLQHYEFRKILKTGAG